MCDCIHHAASHGCAALQLAVVLVRPPFAEQQRAAPTTAPVAHVGGPRAHGSVGDIIVEMGGGEGAGEGGGAAAAESSGGTLPTSAGGEKSAEAEVSPSSLLIRIPRTRQGHTRRRSGKGRALAITSPQHLSVTPALSVERGISPSPLTSSADAGSYSAPTSPIPTPMLPARQLEEGSFATPANSAACTCHTRADSNSAQYQLSSPSRDEYDFSDVSSPAGLSSSPRGHYWRPPAASSPSPPSAYIAVVVVAAGISLVRRDGA